MKKNHDIHTFYTNFVHETDAAWLLEVEEADNEEIWFPKSHCDYDANTGEIQVPGWLAREKGIMK